ncbi:MAG TPA: hypothetical protein VNX68_16530 [Nitrosopumilaceae archaeon]|nr:hypothetical protein [Nitrosopumilaceae archaeon]
MPFQIGDRVRIIPNARNNFQGRWYSDWQENTEGTISGIDDYELPVQISWDNGGHSRILERLIEPVLPPRNPRGPFRVGDRVRYRANPNDQFTVHNIQEDYVVPNQFFTINQPVTVTYKIVLWSNSLRNKGFFADEAELVPNYVPGEMPKIIINPKFTIGSDIECSFVREKKQVNNEIALHSSFREFKEFGTDHGGRIGEFRAKYAGDPREHCYNLKRTIKKVVESKKILPGTTLDASHVLGNEVVGGHIHFGIKERDIQQKCKMNLDYWLLPTIQPLFNKEVFMKRVQVGYGKLNQEDVRQQPHGFEYRVIPSFIFDEQVAKGIFCLAYSIVQLTLQGDLKIRMEQHDDKWIQKFINDYNNYGLNNLHDVREESIKKLLDKNLLKDLYKDIVPLFDAIHQEKKFSGDIAEGWGMEYKYVFNSRNNEEENSQIGLTTGRFFG